MDHDDDRAHESGQDAMHVSSLGAYFLLCLVELSGMLPMIQ